jgi:hypothetical protein
MRNYFSFTSGGSAPGLLAAIFRSSLLSPNTFFFTSFLFYFNIFGLSSSTFLELIINIQSPFSNQTKIDIMIQLPS